ncbi:MAG: SNARE associated Golgi protein, partial [Magnetospirillum sp.]|nr:SNARE associated Golgi protein [Magnetospirillum sp.]
MSRKRHPLLDPAVQIRGLVLIASLVAVGVLLEGLGIKSMLEKGWVDAEVRGHGLAGELLFVLVGGAFTAIGLPRQVVSFLGGYAFGFLAGSFWAVTATVAGAVATFVYARFM